MALVIAFESERPVAHFRKRQVAIRWTIGCQSALGLMEIKGVVEKQKTTGTALGSGQCERDA